MLKAILRAFGAWTSQRPILLGPAAEDCDRRFRQREDSSLATRVCTGYRRAIGICVAPGAVGLPDILLTAKSYECNGSVIGSLAIRLGIFEYDSHLMRIALVPIDQHQGPVAIRPLDGVGRDQHIPL